MECVGALEALETLGQMIRCIEHEKYPNCVRLRTVGTVVSDMGRLRMVKRKKLFEAPQKYF